MGLLLELQKRIPDRWFLRRLLPAALFVIVATVGGGRLGQAHWHDIARARQQIARTLVLGKEGSANTIASLVLVGVATIGCTLAVPYLASAIGRFASGGWPWWLMPLSRRITTWRIRHWTSPEELGRQVVRARDAGRRYRADRLDARRARTNSTEPTSPTWSGDQLRATEARIKEDTGLDVAAAWTTVLLVTPDAARTALGDARDAYDAACEKIAWSAACLVLGAWWWPAAPAGIMIGLTSWRRLRLAVGTLSQTTEAVFGLYRPPREIGS